MKTSIRPVAVVVAAGVLLLGFDLATYAATGDSLLLGKANKATKATKVQRTTKGPVLELKAKPGSPPLKVNSTGKVTKLNADQVDGLSAAALQTTATTYDLSHPSDDSSPAWQLPTTPGNYLVNWQAVIDTDTSPGHVFCALSDGSAYFAPQTLTVNTGMPDAMTDAMSGSGMVEVGSNPLFFVCLSNGGDIVGFSGIQGIQVTLQRVAANPVTPIAEARPGSRGR